MSPRETPVNLEKDADFRDSAALGAAVGAEIMPIDADLARVIEAWPKLMADHRATVLAVIDAANTTTAE